MTNCISRKSIELGFSLVELVLVVAIIGILASVSAPFLTRFSTLNNLETSTDAVVGSLRKAQAYAMSGKNDAVWGVCVSSGKIRLFQGTCASPSVLEDFSLNGVSISGFTEVLFTSPNGKRGEPSSAVTITLTNSIGTRTVLMNSLGGITIN